MDKKVCLIGNPNVGKSSLFNILTNKNQHTGNWTGKTVDAESGMFVYKNNIWEVIDLPGTYSLIGESEEEKITSEYVLNKNYDLAIVVADATNIERSMTLILEVLDVTQNIIVALNLKDEAKKRNIKIDTKKLEKKLGIKIIETSMKEKTGLEDLCNEMSSFEENKNCLEIERTKKILDYLDWVSPKIENKGLALKCLTDNEISSTYLKEKDQKLIKFWRSRLHRIDILESYQYGSEKILLDVVERKAEKEKKEDKIWNKILTNKKTSFPFMLCLLFIILWLTIYFSNIPSDLLFRFFKYLEPIIYEIFSFLPEFLKNPLIYGGYRTLYWVVSVMLPPMMIFFPLFSLLEDYGLLPRIAFNLDKPFQKCGSCGKQSLTMCMGLGCNAVGVTGARIMESKKMRLLSILTNVFMPCNGRFPAMISVITMFFVKEHSILGSMKASLILLLFILLGILLTFLTTKLLNHFILKNEEPIFILELPSFRKPKIWKTIKNSWKEKAFHVLKRAMIVSFPAGIIIFILANTTINQISLFNYLKNFLNPFGLLIGLDGVIILAFLLGLPANEIVIPILLLGYFGGTTLVEYSSLESLKQVLILNGWTITTAINYLIFSLCHFPCATTLLTIKKETNSWFYTFISFLLPTIVGILLCYLITLII